MHIECFEYFHKVAKAKSISKAASDAHISQPALSQQIQKLEESLGYELLKRSNKGVELTEKGLIVLKYADNLVRTYEAMMEHLKEDSENGGTIKIEACWPIATYALPCVLYKIKNKFPHHNYELISNSFEAIEENIRNNIADIGVVYGKPNDSSLAYYEIGTDNLVLVASYDYKIDDEIKFEDFLKYPFVLLNDNLNIEEILLDKIKSLGHQPDELNILYKSDSTESVKSSIFKGYGVAFLPYISIKKELYEKRLKLIKISDFSLEYKMYLINENNKRMRKAVSEFIEYFKEIGKESLC
ncbi:LysR family transcriptional regulator [Caldisalinibacter kiritimatiensis]|uniref:Transcriptional regulator, LysR family n=1 Tax=Caldisalinibacter kiritimatiensis TaxID=1304284 RepID=R1CQ65_9FIRM|nr:LysR family transcriptional regulator [Caldisalinibacter kiritimatiensis]EOD00821.1 Transcriptional regulator, LysR family [Caldisalinibacter kiritimatiensis]